MNTELHKQLIRQYKQEINFVEFLQDEGYVPHKESTSKRWPVLKDPLSNRKLIIGNNKDNGQYFYFNPEDSMDRGNIINYTEGKLNLDLTAKEGWQQLHAYLGRYLGNPLYRNKTLETTITPDISRESAIADHFKLRDLKDISYLQNERFLFPDTIRSPAFAGRIFNRIYKDIDTGQFAKNIVFPLENEKGMIGIIARNTDLNIIFGVKDNAVWSSNINNRRSPNEIVIVESPIDALSHYQLNPPMQSTDRLYLATGGYPSAGQYSTIQAIINRYNPARVVLANDNDNAGIRYNINWLGRLHLPVTSRSQIRAEISNRTNRNTMLIEFVHGDVLKNFTEHDQLIRTLEAKMNKGLSENKAVINVITARKDLTQVEVDFPNQRNLLIRAEKMISEIRQLTGRMIIERSFHEDWNKDLTSNIIMNLVPYQDLSLLQEKGIRPETLNDAAFQGQFFKAPTDVLGQTFDKQIMVKRFLSNEQSGFMTLNGISFGPSNKAVWMSNYELTRPPSTIVIVNTPLDALAYHQIHSSTKTHSNIDRLYIATAGIHCPTMGLSQIQTINEFIELINPNKIILATGRDETTLRTTINHLGRIQVPTKSNPDIKAEIKNNSESLNISFNFLNTNLTDHQQNILKFKSFLQGSDFFLALNSKPFIDILHKERSNESIMSIQIPKNECSSDTLLKLQQIIVTIRNNESSIDIQHPLHNSWYKTMMLQQNQPFYNESNYRNIIPKII